MRIHCTGTSRELLQSLAKVIGDQGHQLLDAADGGRALPPDVDLVLVGSHASADDALLQSAQKHDIPIRPYQEYLCQLAQDKQRIVIVGDDGVEVCLTVMHVLRTLGRPFDYVVDSPLLQQRIGLCTDAPILLVASSLAPASALHPQPQSSYYRHNVLLMGPMATPSPALHQLADASPKGGTLIYCAEDRTVQSIGSQDRTDVKRVPYATHHQGKAVLQAAAPPLTLAAAQQLLRNVAVTDEQFCNALPTLALPTMT